MAEAEIPTGKETKTPQADGTAPAGESQAAPAEQPPGEEIDRYSVGVTWSGDATGCGEVRVGNGSFGVPIGGAKQLGGCGKGANPEELLLAAVGACFVNTWAIFLQKLKLAYAEPAVRLGGTLGRDPAGGYKMTGVTIHALVPAPLLAGERESVEKTLALAEKYCIISKVAKAAMPVTVIVEEV
jgi:organic hydroperoxide reductase OsmC/OhrA